jgi:tRNA dimethylallyltransferase
LETKSPQELFESLAQIDSIRAAAMNFSDKSNPRRLIRAIEVATWKIDNKTPEAKLTGIDLPPKDILFIGLTAPESYLFQMVGNRIQTRLTQGIEAEIKGLIAQGVTWKSQAMTSLGYREWQNYFLGKIDKSTAITDWKREELKYVKRQLTWFKNDPRINWFDISGEGYGKKVENMVKKWYYSG